MVDDRGPTWPALGPTSSSAGNPPAPDEAGDRPEVSAAHSRADPDSRDALARTCLYDDTRRRVRSLHEESLTRAGLYICSSAPDARAHESRLGLA